MLIIYDFAEHIYRSLVNILPFIQSCHELHKFMQDLIIVFSSMISECFKEQESDVREETKKILMY